MPSDLFIAETYALQHMPNMRRNFEARVLVGTIAGWWEGVSGWEKYYSKWHEKLSGG